LQQRDPQTQYCDYSNRDNSDSTVISGPRSRVTIKLSYPPKTPDT